ncbi:hypothetical protein BDQ17DRAFT_1325719 [Cyathus striatus]|nr:hypothetical protein BDQ17DRAFT_1325719 [Cyathus striatus]
MRACTASDGRIGVRRVFVLLLPPLVVGVEVGKEVEVDGVEEGNAEAEPPNADADVNANVAAAASCPNVDVDPNAPAAGFAPPNAPPLPRELVCPNAPEGVEDEEEPNTENAPPPVLAGAGVGEAPKADGAPNAPPVVVVFVPPKAEPDLEAGAEEPKADTGAPVAVAPKPIDQVVLCLRSKHQIRPWTMLRVENAPAPGAGADVVGLNADWPNAGLPNTLVPKADVVAGVPNADVSAGVVPNAEVVAGVVPKAEVVASVVDEPNAEGVAGVMEPNADVVVGVEKAEGVADKPNEDVPNALGVVDVPPKADLPVPLPPNALPSNVFPVLEPTECAACGGGGLYNTLALISDSRFCIPVRLNHNHSVRRCGGCRGRKRYRLPWDSVQLIPQGTADARYYGPFGATLRRAGDVEDENGIGVGSWDMDTPTQRRNGKRWVHHGYGEYYGNAGVAQGVTVARERKKGSRAPA